jgi:osmoprotectant transport system substrate-binding protein
MSSTRLIPGLLAALVLALGVAACGGADNDAAAPGSTSAAAARQGAIRRDPANAKVALVVGSKNFTEQKVLGEIYAQALAAAGYRVRKALNLGDQEAALRALKAGRISGYPEYTGTALLSFLDVPAKDVPGNDARAYDQVRAGMARDGIVAFPRTPFTSSNEVGMLKRTALRMGISAISGLKAKASTMDLYGPPECRERRDCLRGLEDVYGLHFRRFVPINIDQRHAVLRSGRAKLSIVFTTDPQIRRDGEVLLRDDRNLFPPYNSTFLVKRATVAKAGPDLARTLALVNRNLTAAVMQELNARVDLDQDTPEQAAQAYLKQFKLIPS